MASDKPEDDVDAEDEEDLEKLQAEIARMEAEAARITKETEQLAKQKDGGDGDNATGSGLLDDKTSSGGAGVSGGASANGAGGTTGAAASGTTGSTVGADGTPKRDGFSIYVGQVDYSTTPEELLAHFQPCGTVERVTIVCDKMTGRPKGFAYLEFQTDEAVDNAVKLDGSEFKGRALKVHHKRVNLAGFNAMMGAGGRGGGRGFRGGRGYRGGYRGGRVGGRGYRGGRGMAGGYHPYY